MVSYYFIRYSITDKFTNHTTSCVTNKHPFDWLKFYDTFGSKWTLIDWKEIAQDEYEKGKNVVGIG
jgi:hypothetical protein